MAKLLVFFAVEPDVDGPDKDEISAIAILGSQEGLLGDCGQTLNPLDDASIAESDRQLSGRSVRSRPVILP